jgi:23S rRNA (uracil1939-C5)-methyltransferase
MTRKPQSPQSEEPVELSVERLGGQGDGIAEYRGEPVFLPFTVPGDRVRARLGARRGGGREGRVMHRLVSGPGRTDPPCPHFGVCGGCALQHLDPTAYRAVKLGALHTALERVGIETNVVGDLRIVPPERRRARFGLTRPPDPLLSARVGFRQRFRHDLVDLTDCPVLEPQLFSVIPRLRQAATDLLPPGGTAEATVTHTDSGVDVLIEAAQPPGLGALAALAALAEECDLARVVWRSSDEEIPVVERRPVRVMLSGFPVPFPPGAFLQPSRAAEMILVEGVLSGIGHRRPVLDLFAGLGTFAFALAKAGPVHAIEVEERLIGAVARAASRRPGITVQRGDLLRHPPPPEWLSRYAAAVFDPPRAGAVRLAEALAASTLETVAAVSCNPATFARDAARLLAGGYRIERVTPVDQFVWSAHLELVAVFRR